MKHLGLVVGVALLSISLRADHGPRPQEPQEPAPRGYIVGCVPDQYPHAGECAMACARMGAGRVIQDEKNCPPDEILYPDRLACFCPLN